MIRVLLVAAASAAAVTFVAACGGGSGGGSSPVTAVLEFPPSPNSHYYAELVGTQPRAADVNRLPVYSNGRHLMVGVDQRNFDLADLPVIENRGGISVRHGVLNDGAGTAALRRYLSATVDDPALRWRSPPVVRFGGDGDREDFQRAIRAVQLVNAALPDNHQMVVASNAASPDPGTGIYIAFQESYGHGGWGITFNSNSGSGNQITHSSIYINEEYDEHGDRRATILIAHELLHALGFFGGNGHVPEDLASIMEATRDIYSWEQDNVWQPISLLYPADREALRILYTRLRAGGSPTDFGPWASTSTHLVGVGRHTAFGVALRNGYAEPWAYGNRPETTLAGSGTATWTGALLGFSGRQPVAGDARIGVNLAMLTGSASFTSLEYHGRGTIWGDGDLGYTIAVTGNTFHETGGDAGDLTGIFTGRNHEGAAGTLERSDLTAAFGATR